MKRTTAGGRISLTDDGEVLLNYPRRILMLEREIEQAIGKRQSAKAIVRLGLPEDFPADSLTSLLWNSRTDTRTYVSTPCAD